MELINIKKITKEYSPYRWQIGGSDPYTESLTMFTLTGKNVT